MPLRAIGAFGCRGGLLRLLQLTNEVIARNTLQRDA